MSEAKMLTDDEMLEVRKRNINGWRQFHQAYFDDSPGKELERLLHDEEALLGHIQALTTALESERKRQEAAEGLVREYDEEVPEGGCCAAAEAAYRQVGYVYPHNHDEFCMRARGAGIIGWEE